MDTPTLSPEEKIVEAAKVVFVKKGYAAATMSDIATEAGISRTALNYYYRTKENLFEAIFGQLVQTFLPQLEQVADTPLPFLEKIETITGHYINLLVENPLLPMFIVGEINRDATHLLDVVTKLKENDYTIYKIVTQINEEMEKGLLRKMPLIDVVTTFMGITVFPILARNLLNLLFEEGNNEKFFIYFCQRKKLIVEIMKNLLAPNAPSYPPTTETNNNPTL